MSNSRAENISMGLYVILFIVGIIISIYVGYTVSNSGSPFKYSEIIGIALAIGVSIAGFAIFEFSPMIIIGAPVGTFLGTSVAMWAYNWLILFFSPNLDGTLADIGLLVFIGFLAWAVGVFIGGIICAIILIPGERIQDWIEYKLSSSTSVTVISDPLKQPDNEVITQDENKNSEGINTSTPPSNITEPLNEVEVE